jgi:Arc/MetJ family transcription regulator
MRSTLEIDEKLIKKAMKLSGAKTKKEVVNLSLETLIRLKHRDNLKKKLGRFPLDITLSDLEKMREDSE